MFDADFPAVELFRLQRQIAVLAIELIQARRTETLAPAGAHHRIALVQSPGRRDLTQQVVAVLRMVVVAQAAGQGQTLQHRPLKLAIGAVQFGLAATEGRIRVPVAGRAGLHLRLLML
ncbi:hypothetical protein D3C80_1257370 [compost metagenome]